MILRDTKETIDKTTTKTSVLDSILKNHIGKLVLIIASIIFYCVFSFEDKNVQSIKENSVDTLNLVQYNTHKINGFENK